MARRAKGPFWQARYYDLNVWSEMKFVEKLRYIHRNPVKRGLAARSEDSRSGFGPRHKIPAQAKLERGTLEI